MNVKLGKLAAVHPLGALRFSAYTTNLQPAPVTYNSVVQLQHLGLMLNDKYGDCAIAGPGHQVEYWTAQIGKETVISDSDILVAYSAVSGFKVGDPNTDHGCVLTDVLDFWQTKGIGTHIIGGWATLTPPPTLATHTTVWHKIFHGNPTVGDTTWISDLKNALYYFEGSVIGLQLPAKLQSYTDADTWDFVPDNTQASQPGTWGGHCVILVPSYDGFGCNLISWGKVYKVSWNFLAAYMDEAHVAISKDILSGDKSPEGFDYQTLDDDILAREA